MIRQVRNVAVVLGLSAILLAQDAMAWGPRAQRAIPIGAIQVISHYYSDAFKAKDESYEEDMLKGAAAGTEMLATRVPLTSLDEAIAGVDTQIQLLREVRRYGMGSYFAYRMGALGSLTADIVLPYALTWATTEMKLRSQIEADIDSHLDAYSFKPASSSLRYVRSSFEYFNDQCRFYAGDKKMIEDDYSRGLGYKGFLTKGGEAYFSRAIEAVADVWGTVLRPAVDSSDVPPSPKVLAYYFVDEIAYLLNDKRNMHQADKAYSVFTSVNPGMMDLYERIGDLYYAYGTDEARERGVREWRIAYSESGPHRPSVAAKLSGHYLRVGEAYLESSSRAGASERDLPNALDAFSQALEFDRGSDIAATRINETSVAIARREERRQLAINIIASAEKVVKEAEKQRLNKDFGNAIATYKQAIGLFEAVDDEFAEQAKTAKEGIKSINKNINDAIIEVLDLASDSITQGERLVDEHKWDEAQEAYNRIGGILSLIPEDASTHARHKQELVDLAERKKQEAVSAKQRFEAAEQARKLAEQAAQQAAGGSAAPAPAPAPAAPAQ